MSRTCSIVICTFNRADSLRVTLDALRYLDHDSFEVVVVNGPSTDTTEDVLAEWAGSIKVVRASERNLSVSRNLGIAASAGEIVAFLDDDAYPEPAWLDHLANAFDDPEVAAAGGPTLDHTGASWQARFNLADTQGEAWISDGPNPTTLLGSPHTDVFPYPMGTNSAFRRSAVVEAGGFDEEYEFYLDETDVCRRLLDRGWLVAPLDDGVVYHKFLASHIRTDQRATRHRWAVVKNRAYFAFRHGHSHRSAAELRASLDDFVERHRRDIRANIELGLLDEEDAARFEDDWPGAIEAGLERAASGNVRTRPSDWFDADPRPLLPFPALRPSAHKLHVALLSQEFPPGPVNGIGRFVHSLSHGLVRRGHVVRVVTRSETHDRVDFEDGVWVHRVEVRPHVQPSDVDLPQRIWDYSASAADEVARIAERRPIDLVEFPNWDIEGVALVREQAYLTVLSLHTPLMKVVELDPTFPGDDPDIRRIVSAERRLYGEVSALLGNSPSVVDEIERSYHVTLDRSALGMVAHGLASPPVTEPERVEGTVNVLFVGRLERRKGIDVLLDAVPTVLAEHHDVTFTIVGDTTIPSTSGHTYVDDFANSETAAVAGSRVRFLGRVDEDRLNRLYAGCDVLVVPSRYESFGLILLEAMRHGKPVIASDVGGMKTVVEHEGNGLLVAPDSPSCLAAALIDLLDHPERRQSFGQRSGEIFAERFSENHMAEQVERFYLDAVLSPGSIAVVDERATHERRLGIDLGPLIRCTTCGGAVRTLARVVTADRLTKEGSVVCDTCAVQVADISAFVYDFHVGGAKTTTPQPPLEVPALGEKRVAADALAGQAIGGWAVSDRYLFSTGAVSDVVKWTGSCTDASVRLLHHDHSGIVELLVDGRPVGTVDLFVAEGSYVEAHPLFRDVEYGRHRIEIRPSGRRNPDAKSGQLFIEELVLFGPRRRGLGFHPPEPINRGNPMSPAVLRYLDDLPAESWILEVGGGDRRGARSNHVNFEFLHFELADAFGDIHDLPFADDAYDFVFSQAVFEHVSNPFRAAQELIRVTRPGGLIVTEVAFLQPLHAVPYHFFNMTQWGVEELFRDCEIVESDWFGTLSETLDWILRAANLDTKAPSNDVAALRQRFAGLDRFLDHDDIKAVASGVYLVVRKPPS